MEQTEQSAFKTTQTLKCMVQVSIYVYMRGILSIINLWSYLQSRGCPTRRRPLPHRRALGSRSARRSRCARCYGRSRGRCTASRGAPSTGAPRVPSPLRFLDSPRARRTAQATRRCERHPRTTLQSFLSNISQHSLLGMRIETPNNQRNSGIIAGKGQPFIKEKADCTNNLLLVESNKAELWADSKELVHVVSAVDEQSPVLNVEFDEQTAFCVFQ